MTKEAFITAAVSRYEKLEDLNKIDNFYDYEKKFEQIWKDLGREVLEQSISTFSADRRKKKHSQNLDT